MMQLDNANDLGDISVALVKQCGSHLARMCLLLMHDAALYKKIHS